MIKRKHAFETKKVLRKDCSVIQEKECDGKGQFDENAELDSKEMWLFSLNYKYLNVTGLTEGALAQTWIPNG